MKQTLTFLLITLLPILVEAQEVYQNIPLSLQRIQGIRPIAGGLPRTTELPIENQYQVDGIVYSRQIEFDIFQSKNEGGLKAILRTLSHGTTTITFDTDFDNDFTDENSITITDSANKTVVNCEYGVPLNLRYPDSTGRQSISKLKWVPFTCLGLKVNTEDSIFNRYAGALYSQELLYGTSPLIDDSLCVVVQNKLFNLNHATWQEPMFAIIPKSNFSSSINVRPKYARIGDTININGSFIEAFNYDGKKQTVMLRKVMDATPEGYEPGFYVNLSAQYKTIDGSLLSISPKQKAFTLLEFWGTWCAPCKELYSSLDSLLHTFQSVIHYQGIAFDKKEEVVRKYVADKPAIANQVFVDMIKLDEGADDLVKRFKVTNYPTFILIDESGKILLREIGKEGFSNLKSYLKSR
jgi:thiol-disulfide isomerase/thioredoxin